MRRLVVVLFVVLCVLPTSAQFRGGHFGGGVRAFGGGFHNGVVFRGGFGPGFTGGFTFGHLGPNGVRIRTLPPSVFFRFFGPRPGISPFCFNNPFLCGGVFGGRGFGFGGFSSFGGFGLPVYGGYPAYSYLQEPSAADAEHVLRYREDDRDRVIDDLRDELRDQRRQLDYLERELSRRESDRDRDRYVEPRDGAQPRDRNAPPPPQSRPQSEMRPRGRGAPSGMSAQGGPAGPSTANTGARPTATLTGERPAPATVLVMKNGTRSEIHNYAVVNGTVITYEQGARRRIPLADVDVQATERANDERGVVFRVPKLSVSVVCAPNDPNINCRQAAPRAPAPRDLQRPEIKPAPTPK